MNANYHSNWINEINSKEKIEEIATREQEHRLKFVEHLVLNTFHMDVQLKKLEEKISSSKDIEQIIPRMLLHQYIDALKLTNNKNKEILINITINN